MPHAQGDVLLVGSVPRESAEEVFQTCSAVLGTHLQALPDGEVGARKSWIQCQAKLVFNGHPALETVRRPGSQDGLAPDYTDNWVFRVRPGIAALEFGDLGYARWALESYKVFRALRQRNEITPGMRFQVSIPTPLGGCATFFDQPGDCEVVYRSYESAIMREVTEICRQIPAQDLAIQWDVLHRNSRNRRECVLSAGGSLDPCRRAIRAHHASDSRSGDARLPSLLRRPGPSASRRAREPRALGADGESGDSTLAAARRLGAHASAGQSQ